MHIMEQDPANFQKTSTILQKALLDLVTAVEMLQLLATFEQISAAQEYRTATRTTKENKSR